MVCSSLGISPIELLHGTTRTMFQICTFSRPSHPTRPHIHMSMNIIHRGIYTETRGLFQPIAQILIYKPNCGRFSLGMYGMKLETTIAPSSRSVLSFLSIFHMRINHLPSR